jgi:hypothetical protein
MRDTVVGVDVSRRRVRSEKNRLHARGAGTARWGHARAL